MTERAQIELRASFAMKMRVKDDDAEFAGEFRVVFGQLSSPSAAAPI